jgi:transposase
MFNYLGKWIEQLKWQRLKPLEKLADTLLKHAEGIANYCVSLRQACMKSAGRNC